MASQVIVLYAVAILSALLAYLASQLSLSSSGGRSRRPLLIGVASRLDRLDQRQAIRQTWKHLVNENPGMVELAFFLAERPCPLDPYWRLRQTSCVPWNLFVPVNVNENVMVRPCRVQPSMVRPGPPVGGLGFRLHFPVDVTQLGLSKRALKQWARRESDGTTPMPEATAENRHRLANLTVELYDPVGREVQAHVNFSRFELESIPSDDGFVYLPVHEEPFARHFEGILRLRQSADDALFADQSLRCNVVWNKMFGEDGLVDVTTAFAMGHARPFSPNACPLVTFVYQVPDLPELRQIVAAKQTQNKCQQNKLRNLHAKLVEEAEDHDDLFYAPDLTDTEENLPLALLKYLESAVERYDFDFVAVTSDESFLAVDQLVPRLQDSSQGRAWRSNFLRSVPVRHFGGGVGAVPQAERGYYGRHYPPMPPDSGSVLSSDLVRYLVAVSGDLTPLASIGASLAVWLAPVNPQLEDEPDWTLGNETTCADTTVAVGPIRDKQLMKRAWSNYRKCGKICKCPRS